MFIAVNYHSQYDPVIANAHADKPIQWLIWGHIRPIPEEDAIEKNGLPASRPYKDCQPALDSSEALKYHSRKKARYSEEYIRMFEVSYVVHKLES